MFIEWREMIKIKEYWMIDTVVIIEDDVEVRNTLKFLIEKSNYQVESYQSAFNAVDDLSTLNLSDVGLQLHLKIMSDVLRKQLSWRQM